MSNRSSEPARCRGLDCKNGLVMFITHPDTTSATSWWPKVVHRLVNPRVLPGVAETHHFQYLEVRFQCIFVMWHSDILLLITIHRHWYVIILFGYIACLYSQNKLRPTPCPILKMCINGVSIIVGLASWVIWVAVGCSDSEMKYRPPV